MNAIARPVGSTDTDLLKQRVTKDTDVLWWPANDGIGRAYSHRTPVRTQENGHRRPKRRGNSHHSRNGECSGPFNGGSGSRFPVALPSFPARTFGSYFDTFRTKENPSRLGTTAMNNHKNEETSHE